MPINKICKIWSYTIIEFFFALGDDKGIELENDIHCLCCLGYKIDIDGDNEEFWV